MNRGISKARIAWIVAVAAGCGGSTTALTSAPDASTDDSGGNTPEASTVEASADVAMPTMDGGVGDARVDARPGCEQVLAKYRAENEAGGCATTVPSEVACCFMQTPSPDCATFCAAICMMKGNVCAMDPAYTTAYQDAQGDLEGGVICPGVPDSGTVYCGAAGRRPAGLRANASRFSSAAVRSMAGGMIAYATKARAPSAVGAWLASCARLEAASVVAFERLADELRAFGAPEALARRCESAAREEERHATLTAALASRHGAAVPAVHVDPVRGRPLVELAIENVVEGCVRETYAAAMVLHMSQHAEDVELREVLAAIADDEAGHAELAGAIADWIDGQLSSVERVRVEAARRDAIAALAQELAVKPAISLVRDAGVPDVSRAHVLLDLLDRHVWRVAA